MANDKFFWFTKDQQDQIKEIFEKRADEAWGNQADSLLGTSRNGELFLQQMSLLGDLLGQQGFGVKPHFQGRNVTLDLVDASGHTIPNALKFSLSDTRGGRIIKGAVVKNTWVGYENSLGKGNMTDSVTYEVLEMVKKLTNAQSAAARAAKSHDSAELIRQLNKVQTSATKKVQSQFRRTQQELRDEYNAAMNTKSASAMARDNRMIDLSSLVHAIAVNRGNRYGTAMYGKLGKSVNIRQQTIDRDVKTIFGALAVAKKPEQARAALVRRFQGTYGLDGINEMLNVLIPFSNLGLEVTNVSNGAYAGHRYGATTSNQVGGFFAAKSNVHFKQKDNYNARQKRSADIYKGLAVSNPLTSQRLKKHGHTGENPEEMLFKYLEVTQKEFEDARSAFVEEAINKEIEKEKARLANGKRSRALSSDSEAKLRAELHKRMTGITQSLSTLSSDTYGITKEMKEVLDDYIPKNQSFTEAEIERYQKHYKSRGKWLPRGEGKQLSRTEAVKELLAKQIAGKKKIPYARVLASISGVTENTDYAEKVGDVKTSNFSYHLNRRMNFGDKILGGQGDRATTFAVQQAFLEFLAKRVGAPVDASHRYSAVTLQRGINARNFEEWFLPRMTALAQHATSSGNQQKFADDFNKILNEALGKDVKYYTREQGRLVKRDVGLSDLFSETFSDSKTRSKALGDFLVKWGGMFADYGLLAPGEKGLLSWGKNDKGETILSVNQELNKKIPLLASFNAISKDWYGPASTKGSVHLDRRAEYALKREIAEAEMSTGSDFSKYRLATQRWMGTTGLSKEELKRRQDEFTEAAAITMGSLSAPKGGKVFDPRDWNGTAAAQNAWVGGRLLGSEFLKTPLGKIWLDYQGYKKSNGGNGAGYQALLKMPARFALTKGKGKDVEEFYNDLVAIPTSILEGLSMEKGAGGIDFVSGVSSYHTDLNSLLNHAYENALAAATGGENDQLKLNDSVASLLETIRSDLYDNQGNTYREANRALIGRSGYAAAEKNSFLNKEELTKLLGSESLADTAIEIATTGALLQYKMAESMYGRKPLREAGETDAEYNAKLQRAVSLRELDFDKIYKNASPETKKLIEKELSAAGDDLEKRFNILSRYNLRGVTVDDKFFQGISSGGLQGKFARGPLTEGADIISAAMYLTHKGLDEGKGYLAQGAGWRANLDFDGDEFMAMLALNDASIAGLSRDEIKQLYDNEQVLQNIRKRKTEFADEILRRKQRSDSNKGTALKLDDLDLISDVQGQTIAEWAGKANFGHTGILDNIRQRLSYNLSTALLDEAGYSARGGDNGKMVNALITRHVFEAMSQDAISSKKILDRYKKKLGTDNEIDAYFGFIDDLSGLMNRISKNEQFGADDTFKPFVKDLVNMGILDDKEGFDERISTTLMQDIAAHDSTRKHFYEKYVRKNKGALTDEEKRFLSTTNTKSIEYYDWLRGMQTKDGKTPDFFHFTPEMIAEVLTETNKDLTAAEAVKKIFLPGKGTALGKALTYSSIMPGKEGDDPFKEFGPGGNPGAGGGGGAGDPMNKAANTLLKAAEALLELAKGGAGGGGSGGGHNGRIDDNLFVPRSRYFSGTAAAKVLRPGNYNRLGGDATEFVNTIKAHQGDKYLGYDSETALIEAFGSWWGPMRGTQVGNLLEMIKDAERFGINVFKDRKNGELLPITEIVKKIKNSRSKAEGFKEWRSNVIKGQGSSGTDKSFWKQYEDFSNVLNLIGDDRLKVLTRDNQATIGGTIEDIAKGVAVQYQQVENTLKGHRLGKEGNVIDKIENIGTEVGVSAALSQNLGLSGFLDTLNIVSSGKGENAHKAFATVDLKRLWNGKPNDEQMIQMYVYQTILDDLTTAVTDSWGKGDHKRSLKEAYANFQKTRHGKSLGWTEEQFAKTEGIDTDALVAMSIIDNNNIGKSVYLNAHSSTKQFLKEYVLGALERGEPIDDLKMQILASAFSSSITGEALHGSADEKMTGEKGPLKQYAAKYGLTQTKMNEIAARRDWYQERLDKGLYSDFNEKADVEKTLEKLGLQYQELQEKVKGYREELEKANFSEEEIQEAEKSMSQVLQKQNELYKANIDLARNKYRKKETKTYEQLLNEYNQQIVSQESDALTLNKSTNSLEKRALTIRMEDRESTINDLEERIEEGKAKLKELGLSDENIEELDAKGAQRLKLMEDTMMVKNKGIGSLWDSLATSFKNIFTRFTQMGMAYSMLGKLKKAFAEVVQSATQLDKAMVNLRVVTGASYEDAKSMIHGYAKLGSELAATTLEVSTAAQEWLRQGYDVAEVNKLVESSIKLSVLGMMSASDATKSLTSAMKGFKLEAGDVSEIVDKFTSLDMKAATTAGDIATALSKFATTAQMAGVDIDQAAAMATTIMDVSQNDAGATGNALKTIFSRFGNVKAGTYQNMASGDSDDTTDKINDIERVLSTLGIQVRSTAREMRDFDDVLDDIAEKWQYLDSVSQNAIATALAGTRQRESFAVLMNNYDKYKEFIEVSKNSTGTADEKYQSYLEQFEASQKRLKAAWEDIANSSEIAGFMTKMNNFLSGVVSVLPTIIRYVTKLFVTLNSYKIPKLLNNFLGFGNKGFFEGVKEAGKKISYNLTSSGLQERADKYNTKESRGFLDTIYGPARRVAEAFNAVAEAAERVVQGDIKKTEASEQAYTYGMQEASASQKEAAATYTLTEAKDAEVTATFTAAGANLTEANASMVAANADALESGVKIPSNIQVTNVQGAKTKQSLWNNFKPSKQGAGMAAVGGLTSAFMGATMGNQGLNFSTGQMQEASKGANVAATVNSTLSNIGYIWGPIVGMLANTLADLLNKFLIIPLIDFEANARKARVEHANKLYDQLSGLSDNVQALTGYAKEASLSAEDTKEMTDAVYQLLSEYYSMDKDARSGVENSLIPLLRSMGFENIDSIYDAMQEYMKGDADVKKKIARALDYAEKDAALEQERNKNEDKNYNLTKEIKDLTERNRNYSGPKYRELESLALRKGYFKAAGEHHSDISYVDPTKMSYDLHEYIEMIDEVLESLDETKAEEIAKYQDLKKQVEDYAAVRKQEMDAYNKQAAQNALLIAKVSESSGSGYLLDQNADQLKNMGADKIIRLIADQMVENGQFSGKSIYIGGNSNNGLTDYARDIIMQAAQADPVLAAALTGVSYSVSDLKRNNGLYDWDNRQKEYENLVESFSSALHMTQDEFIDRLENGDLADRIGNMTLGDFLKTPEELRQSMEDLSSLFQSLANNAFLTAENLEKVINNYPQFIKYLGDTSNLMDAMVQGLAEYAQVYTTKIYDQLISSTDYAEGLKTELYKSGDYDEDHLRKAIGGATTVKEIIEVLKNGTDDLTSEEYNKLVDTFTHLFDKIDVGQIFMRQIAVDTVMPYLDARLDRQLEALNKQKEALQQINKQREYENKLIEARNKLEEAGKEKTRVWREGVGWVYEANQDAIAEAQKNLQEVENERQIRELDIMIDQINAEKELIKAIQDDAKFKALEESMTTLLGNEASETGINGLINITKKLYDGDDSIADSLGKTGETLAELKNQLAILLKNQFDIDYSSSEYSAAQLKEIAESKESTDEQKQKARKELERRGYNFDWGGDYNNDGTQNFYLGSYTLPSADEKVEESDIKAAIEAYDLATNKGAIASWLKKQGYELDSQGKWVKSRETYTIDDPDSKIDGPWYKTEDPLVESQEHYKHIQDDFKAGSARYYEWDAQAKAYKDKGKIKDHKTQYLDDPLNWAKEHPNAIINGAFGAKELAIAQGGQLYRLSKASVGSLALPGGPTLVNERGTEAIVTPYGTVTSLPTGTGVVPADVTKNLWALGEVAPAISRLLNPMIKSGDTTFGDNFNVQNMVINMNPDGSFDVDTFVNELKSVVALRKNS